MSDDLRTTAPIASGTTTTTYDSRTSSTYPAGSQPPFRSVPAPADASSGFATGLLVAAVFVVVGILAYVFYAPEDASVPAAAPAPAAVESTTNPAPVAEPEAAAPAVVPDAAAPDAAAPDAAAPAVAPDAAPAAPAATD
jgi:hypothetical protein